MISAESSTATSGAPNVVSFSSTLREARERFLAAVVDNAISTGRRSATDFLRAFSVREIMMALKDHPRLRANLLVSTTGVHERIAIKKSAESAGDDLDIALSEKVTNEEAIVGLFDPDDRVRYLDHARLWAFVADGEFWKITEGPAAAIAQNHIGFILSRARTEKLLSARDLVDGIGIETLVESLPRPEVARLLESALLEGRAGTPFKDEGVLDVLPPARILEFVQLAHVWDRVIAPKLAYGSVQPIYVAVAEEAPASFSPEVIVEDSGEPIVIEHDGDEEVTANLEVDALLAGAPPVRPTSRPGAVEEAPDAAAASERRKSVKPVKRAM